MESEPDTDERVESLPWEHIGRPDDSGRRKLVILAVAVFVGAVTASATRTLWPNPPLVAPPATTSPAPTAERLATLPTRDVPETTHVRPVTEADLRAVAPGDATRAVAAHAQWFVTEWLTVDGEPSTAAGTLAPDGVSSTRIDAEARSFVESAFVMSVAETDQSTWEVSVLVRAVSASGEDGFIRIPPRAFVVTVGMSDEGPFVVDLPTPAPLVIATGPEREFGAADAPAGVIDAAIDEMRYAGDVEEESVTSAGIPGFWRVSGTVRDVAGVPLEVVVWLDETGVLVPAPVVP